MAAEQRVEDSIDTALGAVALEVGGLLVQDTIMSMAAQPWEGSPNANPKALSRLEDLYPGAAEQVLDRAHKILNQTNRRTLVRAILFGKR